MTHNLPPELTAQLMRLIRRVRLILLARGLLAVAAVTVGAVLAIMGIDAAVVLYHPAARWAFSLAGLALAAATAWTLLVRPLAQPLTLTRMARVLETRHPGMQERISSAIELAGLGGADSERASSELVRLLTQDAASDLAGVRAKQEFTVRTVKPFLVATAAVLAVLTALFALWPKEVGLLFWRALAPHLEIDNLQAAALKVEPGDILVLSGSPLRLIVEAPERHGLRADVHFQRAGRPMAVERMKRLSPAGVEPVVFELSIPSVDEGFEYRVRYGSGYTRPYTVLVVSEPRVAEARVTYSYPAYTGLQATQQVGEAQAISAVAGTRVRIEASFDRPCDAALRINALALPAARGTNAVWLQTLSTNRTGRWALTVRDLNQFTNRPAWAAFTALPDRPPEVTLREPEASRLTVPPYDRLVCVGDAQDDFGFGEMALVIDSEKRPDVVVPLKVGRVGAARAVLEGSPDLQALYRQGLRSFRMYMRVADNLPAELGGPNVRLSRAVHVTLEGGARTLREQLREAARKELEEDLRKASQQLHEAASRVAEEKGSYDKPELSERAAQKLEAARQAAVQAEELMERAAKATEKTPFEAFAKQIVDVRDEKVEPALQKLEKIPLTSPESRRQAGDEAERALREAAEKVNELVWKSLQEENRKQEEQSRLNEVAQREAALAEQAREEPLNKQEMSEWASRQSEAEQRLWQSKPQLEEQAFNQVLENVRKARELMQQAERALPPEQDQAMRREAGALEEAEKAASLAEQAAEKALEASEKAEQMAERRAASDALHQAAQKTQAAAKEAEQAARQAEQAAQARQANERKQDLESQRAIAEKVAQAAQQAQQGAAQAQQSAEHARQAAEARQAGRPEQAAAEEKRAGAQAEQARKQAAQANAEAVEGARQADEQQGMEKAEEAGQLASEAAAFTQRAAELAQQAANQGEAAAKLPHEQRETALKESKGLAEQARQVAAEAAQKADWAAQRAAEQLAQLQQAAQQAEAQQATPEAVARQAQEAVSTARQAAQRAQEAVQSARQAAEEARQAGPLSQALAERMGEAAALAEQAGALAEQSGARTQAAEQAALGEDQERAATRQAMEEARAASQLAQEAAAMANQAAQQAAQEMSALKQEAAAAAQAAAQQAGQAAHKAEQATKLAKAVSLPALQGAAEQSAASARLSRESAALAERATQTLQQATAAADAQAREEARSGQEKARQALELARQAAQAAAPATAESALQQQAAQQARQAAEALDATLLQQERRAEEAWALAVGRLGGVATRSGPGAAGGAAEEARRAVPVNPDWVRFRGAMQSEAYEELLRKTPAEYRELVKQYFEELSRDGQQERKK